MLKRILIASLFASSLLAQNTQNFLTNPTFQALDNNGESIPLGQLCSYAAGTSSPQNLFNDAAGMSATTQPVVMNGGGWAKIYGSGNYKLVLTQPSASTSCPTAGAVIWTYDNVFILSATPTFTSVTATTYTSTATGTTGAFVIGAGTYKWTGAGNLTANTIQTTGVVNSDSTGTNPSFTTNSGSWQVLGNGNTTGQTAFFNQFQITGYAGNPSCAACTSPVSGSALVSYNTSTGALQYNLGAAGWVSFPTIPTNNTGLVYVSSGTLTNSPALTYATGNVLLTGTATNGFKAPVFNATNDEGTNPTSNAFQTVDGGFFVTGSAHLGSQAVATNALGASYVSGANSDLAGTLTLSGGTITISWPSSHTYSSNPVCVANDFSGIHAISTSATTTGLTINGNGSDTVQYLCLFTQY